MWSDFVKQKRILWYDRHENRLVEIHLYIDYKDGDTLREIFKIWIITIRSL